MQYVMAVTSYYFTNEGRTLYNKRIRTRNKHRECRRILFTGVVIAATVNLLSPLPGATVPASVAYAPVGVPLETTLVINKPKVQMQVHTAEFMPLPMTETLLVEDPPHPATIYDIKLSEELQQFTYDVAEHYGTVEHYPLFLALMWIESRYDPTAIGASADYGLTQVNKFNHKWLSEELGLNDFLDPEQNIEAGVYMLSAYLLEYENIHKALMVYNFGPDKAREHWRNGTYSSIYSRAVVAAMLELVETGTIIE